MGHEDFIDLRPVTAPLTKRTRAARTAPVDRPTVNAEHSAIVAEIIASDRSILDRLAEA